MSSEKNIKLRKLVAEKEIELYPETTAKNIKVTPKNNVPYADTDLQKVLDDLDASAFNGIHGIPNATTTKAGLMSPIDKRKVDNIPKDMTSVSVTPILEEGTEIAEISVNDTINTIYAPTIPDSLPASNTTNVYSPISDAPASGIAINGALNTLNAEQVGGSSEYIQSISETNGIISAKKATMPDSLPASDVYPWAKASTKPSYSSAEVGAIPSSMKGIANGVAELDSNGKIPASQLPSFTDDIIDGYYFNEKFYEDSGHTIEITGESGKIYVDVDTGLLYRWNGSVYVPMGSSLALGETETTAYRGDRGKIAYDHSQAAHAPSDAEKNQNAFSYIQADNKLLSANSPTDTFTLTAGDNVFLVKDRVNNEVIINSIQPDISDLISKDEAISDVSWTNYDGSLWLTKPNGDSYIILYANDIFGHLTQGHIESALGYTPGESNLMLGEDSDNAFYGDLGKEAYDHSQEPHARVDATNTTINQKVTSGTELASISINGTTTKIYAPTIPDSLPASDTVNTYSPTSEFPISGKGVKAALDTIPSMPTNMVKKIQIGYKFYYPDENGQVALPDSYPASIVDETYQPSSTIPTCGKAISQALSMLKNPGGGDNPAHFINDITQVNGQISLVIGSFPNVPAIGMPGKYVQAVGQQYEQISAVYGDVKKTYNADDLDPISGAGVADAIENSPSITRSIEMGGNTYNVSNGKITLPNIFLSYETETGYKDDPSITPNARDID